jgi:LPXTG-motif cell wall-anchored protein
LLDYKVAEGQLGSFDVVDNDGPTAIKFLATPTADCVADPETSVKVVCDDATGAATIQYDWVNSSYTTAHFSLQQNGATFQEGDYQASDHVQTTSIPVAEGSQAVASITVDGDEASAIDQLVDCVPDVTTTTVTPDTTPATIPDTTPETTTTVVAVLLPDSGQPSTSVVRPAPVPEYIMLPETGSKNSTTTVAGITLLGLGLALVRLARRAR